MNNWVKKIHLSNKKPEFFYELEQGRFILKFQDNAWSLSLSIDGDNRFIASFSSDKEARSYVCENLSSLLEMKK